MTWIIRCRDLYQMIKEADTLLELTKIKNALYDEQETVMLSNRMINDALDLVNHKIKNFDKEKAIQEILDYLL